MSNKSCVSAIETIAAINKLLSLLCSQFVVELIGSATAMADVEWVGDAMAATVSTIVSLMMALLVGLPIMFDGKGNCGRKSTSFVVEMAGVFFMIDAIGDLERTRLSRFEDLSVDDDFGDDLLLSYDDFRGDFELSFGDEDDLLLLFPFPASAK